MAAEFSFANALYTEGVKWGVPLLGGLVAVFFTPLIDSVKLRLNKVELRVRQYEEFARDMSAFIFEAELQHEFRSSTWATAPGLEAITKDYNAAITTLRGKEIVYLSWAERYWGRNHLPEFQAVLSLVRQVDEAVHAFNDGKVSPERFSTLQARTKALRDATLALLGPEHSRKA